MPNAFAYLVLGLWPLISIGLFRTLPAGRALLASVIVAYLFLPPPPAAFNFPLVPALNKQTIPSLTLLLICVTLYRGRLRLIPESKLAVTALLAFIFIPVLTGLTNLDPVFYGRIGLPGLGIKDVASLVLQQFLLTVPMLLGRALLIGERDLRDLLMALCIAGLIYSLPMLLEVRLSPQLNIWIYGYFQHYFDQMVRYGGYRPIVFLYHGLWVAFFAMISLASIAILFRTSENRKKAMLFLALFYMAAVLILCKSVASVFYAAALLPLLLFVPGRMQIRIAAVLVAIAIAYPALKGADLVPEEAILQMAEKIDAERAGSLRYRFDNESVLLDRAMDRPFFGWGSWGRNHILDPMTGEIETVTDGQWVIAIGIYGWVGFLAQFTLLASPVFLLLARYHADRAAIVPLSVAGLSLILGVNVLDLLPNATLTPITWLMAGALLGYAEKGTVTQEKGAADASKPKMKLQSIM